VDKDKQAILERIAKLLMLATDQKDQHEGNTALQMARKLMRKYRIDESEIQMKEESKGINILSKPGVTEKWEINLAGAIASCLDCRAFVHNGINFLGIKSDVETCVFLYSQIGEFLHLASHVVAVKHNKELFHMAALEKIIGRLQVIMQPVSIDEKALVLRKENIVDEAWEELKNQLDMQDNMPEEPDFDSREAWMAGRKAGASAPMNKHVGE
jgi:hypothetical protein